MNYLPKKTGLLLTMITALLLGGLCHTAEAQRRKKLDDAQFIDELRAMKMDNLLEHFLKKNPPKDAIQRLEIQLVLNKAKYDKAGVKDKEKTAQAVISTYQEMLKLRELRRHYKKPMKATDFAIFLLDELLPNVYQNAAEFVEFGMPKLEAQRKPFDKYVRMALGVIDEAGLDFSKIGRRMQRDRDFQRKYVNTGIWDDFELMYHQLRFRYIRGRVGVYGAMLTELSRIEQQVIADSLGDLRTLSKNQRIGPVWQGKTIVLLGRAQVNIGQTAAAVKNLDKAIAMEGLAPLDLFLAYLAKSKALQRQADGPIRQRKKAEENLKAAELEKEAAEKAKDGAAIRAAELKIREAKAALTRAESAVKAAAANRKVVVEQAIAVLKKMREGEKRLEQLFKSTLLLILSYDRRYVASDDTAHYIDLLNDKNVQDPVKKAAVETWIREALTPPLDKIPSPFPDGTQPFIAITWSKALELEANALNIKAKDAVGSGKEALQKKAKGYLDIAVPELAKVVAIKGLQQGLAVEANYMLGLVNFRRGNTVDAVKAWTDLAEKFPQVARAIQAGKFAVNIGRQEHKANPANQDIAAAFERAMKVFIEKFPLDPFVDDVYYNYGFLSITKQEYAAAAEHFGKISEKSKLYTHGRFLVIHALYLAASQGGAQQVKFANQLRVEYAKTKPVLQATIAKTVGADQAKINGWLGLAILNMAEIELTIARKPQVALALFIGFDDRFGKDINLMIRKWQIEIRSNQEANNAEAAKKVMAKLRRVENGKFVGAVAAQMLAGARKTINRLRRDAEIARLEEDKKELRDRAKKIALGGIDFANDVLKWARQQLPKKKFKDDEQQVNEYLLPFQNDLGEMYIVSGQCEKAVALFKKLESQVYADGVKGQKKLDVVYGLARAYVCAQDWDVASMILIKLEKNIPKDRRGVPLDKGRFKDIYWDTWRLVVEVQRGKHAAASGAEKKAISKKILRIISRLEGLDSRFNSVELKTYFENVRRAHQ